MKPPQELLTVGASLVSNINVKYSYHSQSIIYLKHTAFVHCDSESSQLRTHPILDRSVLVPNIDFGPVGIALHTFDNRDIPVTQRRLLRDEDMADLNLEGVSLLQRKVHRVCQQVTGAMPARGGPMPCGTARRAPVSPLPVAHGEAFPVLEDRILQLWTFWGPARTCQHLYLDGCCSVEHVICRLFDGQPLPGARVVPLCPAHAFPRQCLIATSGADSVTVMLKYNGGHAICAFPAATAHADLCNHLRARHMSASYCAISVEHLSNTLFDGMTLECSLGSSAPSKSEPSVSRRGWDATPAPSLSVDAQEIDGALAVDGGDSLDDLSLLQTRGTHTAKPSAIRVLPTPCRTRVKPPAFVGCSTPPTILCLESLIPVCEDKAVEAAIQTHAHLDSLLQALDAFQLENLYREIDGLGALHPATVEAFAQLAAVEGGDVPRTFHFFVDGSFCEETGHAGWAVVALSETSRGLHWLGFWSGDVLTFLADAAMPTLDVDAFTAELVAQVVAIACAANLDGQNITIHFDCEAASGVATGKFAAHRLQDLAAESMALYTMAERRNVQVRQTHVRAHQGAPFNECADTVAKCAARGVVRATPPMRSFMSLLAGRACQQMWWIVTDLAQKGVMPGLHDDGTTFAAQHSVPAAHAHVDHLPGIPAALSQLDQASTGCMRWMLSVATYNANTLKSAASQLALDACFHKSGTMVVGIQETRAFPGPKSFTEHYVRFASQDCKGQLGCQLWISKAARVLQGDVGASHNAGFDISKAVVFISRPRLLVVTVPVGNRNFGFFVGHAPTSAAPAPEIEAWWHELDVACRRLPTTLVPIFMLDANARVETRCVTDRLRDAAATGDGAHCLQHFAAMHGLAAGPLFDKFGKRHVTWTAPHGGQSQIDYVLLPESLSAGIVMAGLPSHFVDPSGIDHSPLQLVLKWTDKAAPAVRPCVIDAAQIRTPQGQVQLADIYRRLPNIPWTASPDLHLQMLNDFLYTELCAAFPQCGWRPRQRQVSDVQWRAIRTRRHTRRLMHQCKSLQRRLLLWQCLRAWTGDRRAAHTARRQRRSCWQREARLVTVLRDLARTIHRLQNRDDAAFARRAMQQARGQGLQEMARLFRGILKLGRRYRTPSVLPALEVNGEVLADADAVHAALEAHFAVPENGRKCLAREVVEMAAQHDEPPMSLDVAHIPSMPAIASGFLALKCGRAPGASRIPAEAYRFAALDAAVAHYPLCLKSAARGSFPLLWRGTLSVAIPKGHKPANLLSGWRHIALLEASAKGVGKSIRRMLAEPLRQCAGHGQHGALAGQSIGAPAHAVIAYGQSVRKLRQSGAVLFLDGKSAYYSVLREFLVPQHTADEAQRLQLFLQKLHHTQEEQDALLAALAGPGILAQAGVPDGLISFIQSALRDSWFSICPYDGTLQATQTGTVPATPLADILFQFAQSRFMHSLSERLKAESLQTVVMTQGAPAPHPAWADDVAVFAPMSCASLVPSHVSAIASAAEACSRRTGVELNFEAGKTECVCFLHGAQSRSVRRDLLASQEPAISVLLDNGRRVSIRVVEQYVHLGSVLHFSGSCLHDVQRKGREADVVYARLHRTLLRNPELSFAEKRQLILGLVHAKLDFGAGLWLAQTEQETRAIRNAYMKHWRSASRALSGIPAKFMDDEAVCSILGVLHPLHVTRVARVRQLLVVASHPDDFLRQAVLVADDWLRLTLDDVQQMTVTCGWVWQFPTEVSMPCFAFVARHDKDIRALIRAYSKRVLRDAAESRDLHARRGEALARF